jgi:NAD-dependent protein deacetylase/lipoamidase
VETATFELPAPLIQALQNARYVAVLTGAGVSAESGVPTFRDALTGLWSQFNPEDLATPEAFQRNPKLVWDWYAARREMVLRAEPNPGHRALAELERRVPRLSLITQNVDGLHQRAGSRRVIELHGNLARVKCLKEGTVVDASSRHPLDYRVRDDASVASWSDKGDVPRCPHCGSYLRPDVVWFGEMLPPEALRAATLAARAADVFFSVGTSGVIEPAASLPFDALERGATVVEVNPERTPLSRHATFRLEGPAGQVLPELVRRVWGR